ncbi:hypothetical protein ACS0TY_035230 [Phlomoides rotata]
MSDIPSELFREILLRLPTESLLRFRSVCKEWLRIIDDSSFVKAHRQNQLYTHTLLVKNRSRLALYSFSLDSLNFINNGPQMIDAIHIRRLIRPGFPRLCNGLILIKNRDNRRNWVIWNPLFKEFCEVEVPKFNTASSLVKFAFGYDYDADDYKVVRIDELFFRGKQEYQTLVYSLKLGSWKKIEDFPCSSIRYCIGAGSTFFNGTLYWPLKHTIISLDLGTENYYQLPLPPVDITSQEFRELVAMDGCLICSLENETRKTFDGWMMKDNGVEKSWIKLFSLQYSHVEVSWGFRLVAYLKRKEQVVLQDKGGFFWFDIGTNAVKKFSIHGLPNIDYFEICPWSLVRLNVRDSAIGLEDVTTKSTLTRKRKRRNEKANTRLKFCVRDSEEMCCSDNSSCHASTCRLCKLDEE